MSREVRRMNKGKIFSIADVLSKETSTPY